MSTQTQAPAVAQEALALGQALRESDNLPAHTPTPWRRPFTSDTGTKIFDRCNSLPIVQCYPPFFRPGTEPQQDPLDVARENAALIVRAVNSHAALVEACEDLLDVLLTSKRRSPYPPDTECYAKIESARAALALAKP